MRIVVISYKTCISSIFKSENPKSRIRTNPPIRTTRAVTCSAESKPPDGRRLSRQLTTGQSHLVPLNTRSVRFCRASRSTCDLKHKRAESLHVTARVSSPRPAPCRFRKGDNLRRVSPPSQVARPSTHATVKLHGCSTFGHLDAGPERLPPLATAREDRTMTLALKHVEAVRSQAAGSAQYPPSWFRRSFLLVLESRQHALGLRLGRHHSIVLFKRFVAERKGLERCFQGCSLKSRHRWCWHVLVLQNSNLLRTTSQCMVLNT